MIAPRAGWTDKATRELDTVNAVVDSLRDYWPVTLRQVYYRLVAAGAIANNRNSYGKLSRILTRARLDGLTPWEALEDRSRARLHSGGSFDAAAFIETESAGFLAGYRRDLMQGQEHAIEVWIEKDALSRVCHAAALPYCVPVTVARGFSSVSYLHDAAARIFENAEKGQGTLILYWGDLDPSGWEMLPAMMRTLIDSMGCGGLVESQRCALTPEQVERFELPKNPDALKDTDSRAAKYRERFGDLAVELDALEPGDLAALVESCIRENLDLSQFERQREIEATEFDRLDAIRGRCLAIVEAAR